MEGLRPTTVRYGDVQCLLAAAQSAEVRHFPVEPCQTQQAFDETGRLTKRQAEQHLLRETNLDCRVAETLLPPALAARQGMPFHLRIKPNRQGTALLQRRVVRRPVPGLV